ncbi:glycosyltransferase family 2 protein [Chloroflexota bacterium]
MKNLSVIVPIYNEEENLSTLLDEWIAHCQEQGWQFIIVDDGSTDGTQTILDAHLDKEPLTVIRHKINKGYGAAIKAGIRAANHEYVITADGDGQHSLDHVSDLLQVIQDTDADMVIGTRVNINNLSWRDIGRRIIKFISRIMIPNHIKDLNSGMKIYRTELARKYMVTCPNTMAFSDIITLTFLHNRCLVMDTPINVLPRKGGKSTINYKTAIDTVIEIVNIVMLFNPLRLFIPIAAISILAGLAWGLPIFLAGRGLSTGALFALILGFISILLGLIAEQLSQLRQLQIELHDEE